MNNTAANRITAAGNVTDTKCRPAAAQGLLPLESVPGPIRQHGLNDMHPWPLVSEGKRSGRPFTSRRVPASEAWGFDEVEYARTPTSFAAVVVDVDGFDAGQRVEAAVLAQAVQPPSWLCARRSSGGVHAVWTLSTPVHRYPTARRGPLDLFGRVSEFYTLELRGDPGYAGVLAHNPEATAYDTEYRHGGWSLDELRDTIPDGWKRPARQRLVSAAGRNVTLFRALCAFAGHGLHTGKAAHFYAIDAEADRLNREFIAPLDRQELRDVLKHVYRYRERWITQGHQQSFLDRQRARGRRSHGGGRRRIYASNADRQRAYRGPTANGHGGARRGAGRDSSVTKQPIPIEPVSGQFPALASPTLCGCRERGGYCVKCAVRRPGPVIRPAHGGESIQIVWLCPPAEQAA